MIQIIAALAGIGLDAYGQYKAGQQQKTAGYVNAATISDVSEKNAQLIEQGSELNAEVDDWNAAALDAQSLDAIERGKQVELDFRRQVKGVIGSQRASYAASGVDVSSGSPVDVAVDTARQGERGALQLRLDAAREAWGFKNEAQGERLQAKNTRKLGTLQAKNTREVGAAQARNAQLGGNYSAASANWGAASTIAGGVATLALRTKYGAKN